jgi:HEAT repeat protein
VALRSGDIERRIAALVAVRGRTAVRRLTRLSHDRDAQMRAAAVRELARRRGNAEAAQALVDRVRDDDDASVRTAAVMALGAHGEAAKAALTAALDDRDSMVRMAAPAALMAAVPDEALALLPPRMTEQPSNLAIEVARVLATRQHADAEAYVLRCLRAAPPALRPQAAVAAQALSGASIDALAPFLRDADPEVSIRIASVLVRREEHRQATLEALRPLAARPDGFLAVRALGVLAGAGDPWALDPIRQALQASDANVRRLAVIAWPQAIGAQGSDCDALAPLLRDTDRSVALLAAMEIVLIASR